MFQRIERWFQNDNQVANKHINKQATYLFYYIGGPTVMQQKDGQKGGAEGWAKVPKCSPQQDPGCGQILFDAHCVTKNLEPVSKYGTLHMKI